MTGAAVAGPSATPRADEILTPDALTFVTELHRRFAPTRNDLLRRRAERRAMIRRTGTWACCRRRPPSATTPPGESRRAGAGPRRPSRRDHRPDRREDDHQRAELRRARLDGGLRGREHPDLGERRRRAAQSRRRAPSPIDFETPDGQVATRLRPDDELADDRRPSARLAPGREAPDRGRRADRRGASSTSGCTSSTTPPAAGPRAAARTSTCRRWSSHLEARLWNEVFTFAEDPGHRRTGTIRATVLIETICGRVRDGRDPLRAARPHRRAERRPLGLPVLASSRRSATPAPTFVLPDRAQMTMTAPFMRAYTELLVRTCHRRGAHAIGGMAAFIPSRRDPEVNAQALAKVRADKEREAGDGFDGSWVAHPDLVPVQEVVRRRPG